MGDKAPAIKFAKIFTTGLFISFLGTLPLGTLNVAAMQISVTDGIVPAMYFVLGAMTTFIAASHPSGSGKNIMLSNNVHRFWLGIMMSAINPVQIPFWFGWSTVLFTKQVLLPRADHYNTYIAGIGIGTLIGNAIFIFGGRLIVDKLNANQNVLNWIIGGVFAVTAVVLFIKMMKRKKEPLIKATGRRIIEK